MRIKAGHLNHERSIICFKFVSLHLRDYFFIIFISYFTHINRHDILVHCLRWSLAKIGYGDHIVNTRATILDLDQLNNHCIPYRRWF